MPAHFDLIITADYPSRTAEFTLRDSAGVQIAFRQTDFKTISISHQQGLFDLRNYLRLYVEEGKERAAVAEIGVCISEEVLGKEIFEKLWASESQRTLRIQLPGADDTENLLAAALARAPWEIARPKADADTLGERNLLVRVVHDMKAPASVPIELAADEPLRVLFVFAESRGSRPLGARKERRELLRLFEKEIYPQRRIVAHFLTHGVTRERLAAQIQENGGYHVVHWSGHGHMNLLELCKPGGTSDRLSGQELLDLFNDAGGFLPRLFFLSACHSGDILRVKDWNDFLAVAQGKEPGTKEADTKDLDLKKQPGYTGTAHALLQGGVPSVVAMRYAVGDDYARESAVEFYRALLAHAQPKNVAAALTMARQTMLDEKKHDPARYNVCDHATPVLYGEEQPGLTLVRGRSPALNPRTPRLHPITELTTAGHEHFVGRTWELVGLGADFIGSSMGAEVKPVAVITGLGGMGKTALTAEALALWESRFEWVLLYQAKPNPLGFDATLRDIHLKLMGELKLYHDHVRANPADAIYRNATAEFTGPARLERLTRNLLRALKDEPILIVLDNFETNLKPSDPTTTHSSCQDSAWDRCLTLLAKELVGSPSRVLITCRRPLAALEGGAAHSVLLGPLPGPEAALYLKEQPTLSRMVFGEDKAQKALACRLLNASRFHPLLMDRLAKLAAEAALRPQLLAALEALEKTKDFARLPSLFSISPGDTDELAYLDDAIACSLDQLIRDCGSDARRLLWMVAVANGPIEFWLVESVWTGESFEHQKHRQIKQMLEVLPLLSPELQAKLNSMPPDFRAMIDALPPEDPIKQDIGSVLRRVASVGLVTEEHTEKEYDSPNLACHELVRERIRRWMVQHSEDRKDMTEKVIHLAYAERLEAVFKALRHQDMTNALHAGIRAVIFFVQAESYDRLGAIAGGIVASTSNPRLLEALVPHLQAAAEFAPEGIARWRCLFNLADALRLGNHPETSLPFFEQAAAQARAVAEAGGENSMIAWGDLAAITGNWADALRFSGHFDAAKQGQLNAAGLFKKAGRSEIDVICCELEALRIDVIKGNAAMVMSEIQVRLNLIEKWWRRHRWGYSVPEAVDTSFLARAFIAAINIAADACISLEDWPSALDNTTAVLELKRELERPAEDIAETLMHRARMLACLDRIDEAKADLESCLPLLKDNLANSAKALNALANLFFRKGDLPHAIAQERRALVLQEQLPDVLERISSHNGLAAYLRSSGTPTTVTESHRHHLAAFIYAIVAGLGQHIQTLLHNYVIDFHHAHAAGTELVVPLVTKLLDDPSFIALNKWLRERQVAVAELQTAVDQYFGQARQAAEQATANV